MREILFKAKRIDNGEWVEGNLVLTPDADEDFKAIIIPFNDNGEYTEGVGDECLGFETWYKVDMTTLCQYTGLTDKNGNKIWENDVVECQSIIGRIGWNETHMAYTILASVDGNMQYYYIDESLSSDIEVIGNIFDNPELIKECD